MRPDWLSCWESGQIGWHQANGSSALRKFWPGTGPGARVLVPLCGKSPDLLWLAAQGCEVTGVELSEIAVRAFFDEAGLEFEVESAGELTHFRCPRKGITMVCGDYFSFSDRPFDALYDRACLIALPPALRPDYIQHTKSLLKADATQLLLTLEYDQSKTAGPPFSVPADEVKSYWPHLHCAGKKLDPRNGPPKFLQDGVSEVTEVVWVSEKNS